MPRQAVEQRLLRSWCALLRQLTRRPRCRTLTLLPLSARPPPPRLRDTPSVVPIDNCVTEGQLISGVIRWRPTNLTLDSCGALWTICSVVDEGRQVPPSMSKRSVGVLATKSPRCVPEPAKRHHRLFAMVGLTCLYIGFWPLTTDDVIAGIQRLSDKHSTADPIPTSVLKQVGDVVASFIVELFNRLMSEGHFPAAFKEAFITSTVKKAGMDATDVSSY